MNYNNSRSSQHHRPDNGKNDSLSSSLQHALGFIQKIISSRKQSFLIFVVILGLTIIVGLWRIDNSVVIVAGTASSSTLKITDQEQGYYAANPSRNLWIYVESWQEGIAGWRPSLSHVLLLAKTFNATLVEPNIVKSRLSHCNLGSKSKDVNFVSTTTLSDIMNRTLITNYHSKLATCQEYQEALKKASESKIDKESHTDRKTNLMYVDVCWSKEPKCLKNGVPTDHSHPTSPNLWKALETASKHPSTMVVLRFHDLWQNSMARLQLPQNVAPQGVIATAKQIASQHLQFKESLVELLDAKLSENFIVDYSVIHWRAEHVKHHHYMECANAIVQARNAMMKSRQDKKHAPTFFVTSSLSTQSDHSWNGARIQATNTTAPQALELLHKEGILQLEDSLLASMDFDDNIYYVALDLILASRATSFATCTERCRWPKYHVCKRCNWIGNFAHLALELRGDEAAGSLPCWPQTARQVEAIAQLSKH